MYRDRERERERSATVNFADVPTVSYRVEIFSHVVGGRISKRGLAN